jgi:hypothetical protein
MEIMLRCCSFTESCATVSTSGGSSPLRSEHYWQMRASGTAVCSIQHELTREKLCLPQRNRCFKRPETGIHSLGCQKSSFLLCAEPLSIASGAKHERVG